ncbi:transposase, partial [Salmonella enterica subsp. enterica serovar Carrau]|nr:transposase [Salmonella enterica subsp. enterica]EGI6062990.1 transposase [Salmonella enterica subsp. enterica serovar Carrau]EHD9042989.1 transposase [Salmonella enterica subsp. enterica serovar Carrau]
QFLGHSRQAWYQYNTRCNKRQEHHAQVLDFVARTRCRQPRIGTRKLHYLLNMQTDNTIYNHERPHLALKYKTPDDVHQAFYRQKTVNLYQD